MTSAENLDTKLSKAQLDDPYIAKYLPQMETALRNANSDDLHLLSSEKLKNASNEFYNGMKLSIVSYLIAIKPIAYVERTKLSNDSCGYKLIRQHVDILHTASKKGFRCLKLIKISMSNVYADVPTVCSTFSAFNSFIRFVF